MKIYIRTRSSYKDYQWISEPPKSEWWKRGGRHYNTDYPLIYVSKDTDQTKIFMSGIPSARIDKSKSGIRYDFAIELDNISDSALISEFIAPLVAEFVLLLRKLEQNKFELPRLSLILDEIFTEEALALFFKDANSIDCIDRYQTSITKFKHNFNAKTFNHICENFIFPSESWFGSILSNEAFNKFNEFILTILFKEINCIALYANLIESISSVDSLFEILYDENIIIAILTPMDINTCPDIRVLKKKTQNTPSAQPSQTQNNWKLNISISILILTILILTVYQCPQNNRQPLPQTTQNQILRQIKETKQVHLTLSKNSLEINLTNSSKTLTSMETMIIKMTNEIQMNQKSH